MIIIPTTEYVGCGLFVLYAHFRARAVMRSLGLRMLFFS